MDDYGVTRPLGDASRFRRSVRVDVCGHLDRGVPEELLRQQLDGGIRRCW